jgi:AcrR family transcriptional regulator
MESKPPSTRDRIISAASKLYYGEGIRAVSMDAVAEKAGVTKRTLYYHFASKDDLIAAYLESRDQPNLLILKRWFTEAEGDLAAKVGAIFTNLALGAKSSRWRGCGFLRTAAELAAFPGHPAMVVGRAHKKKFEDWLAETLGNADLARQIVVLVDGAFSSVLLHRDTVYMDAAGAAAVALVRAAMPTNPG